MTVTQQRVSCLGSGVKSAAAGMGKSGGGVQGCPYLEPKALSSVSGVPDLCSDPPLHPDVLGFVYKFTVSLDWEFISVPPGSGRDQVTKKGHRRRNGQTVTGDGPSSDLGSSELPQAP